DRVRDEAPDPGEHGLEVPEEETAYDADKGAEGHVSGDPGPGVDAAVPARADKGPAAPAPAAGRGATGAARAPAVPSRAEYGGDHDEKECGHDRVARGESGVAEGHIEDPGLFEVHRPWPVSRLVSPRRCRVRWSSPCSLSLLGL